ncbi:tetratricopeptide repeat protein [Pseudoalteromonas mariniglutinosa]|uniref:tetratricopeptide repeat protein n=1 Tax=Pseudoalteromonas mariniglutinosa TaxID=206042 RepID=UPI00384F2E33
MNTNVYKTVLKLAGELMDAAKIEDQATFNHLYTELHDVCVSHENSEKDHPVQWETLADFTEELNDALIIYDKALVKATTINDKDYMASIAFSMASLHAELGQKVQAIKHLESAQVSAKKIADKVLKAEIHDMLSKLS